MPTFRPDLEPGHRRCATFALALALVGAFAWLAVADHADRTAAAARERVAVVEREAAAIRARFDQDARLLDRLTSDPGTAAQLLALAPALVPGVRAAAIFDEHGAVSARAPDSADSPILDGLATEAKAALVGPAAPTLVVTRPSSDLDRGLDLIGLARARRDAEGRFAGLALIAIDTTSLAARRNLPSDSTLTIRRDDGTVLLKAGDDRAADHETAAVPTYPLEISYHRAASEIGRRWRAAWLRNGAVVGGVGLLAALIATLVDLRRRARTRARQRRDEQALRETAADLAAAADRADEASRAKSRFFAQVTHELRTPLNAIIGFSDTIRGEMFGPVANPRYLEYGRLIHEAGIHLLSLINDLLDVSKLEEGKMEIAPIRVSAAALSRSTLDLIELLARERNVVLATSGIDACPDLTVDPRAAKQVLVNLLSNAIKYTAPGGRIEMSFIGRADGAVAIAVADTGIGMSSDEIRLAFEPFGRAALDVAANTPGTGLGLPIARALVRLHGGELTVTSVPGRGTTATAVFPADAVAYRPFDTLSAARAA